MAVIVSDRARLLFLKMGLGVLDANFQAVGLYVNDVIPDNNSRQDPGVETFVEASGGGYLDKVLQNNLWTVVTNANKSEATQISLTFSFTGPLDNNDTIFGWFMVRAFSGSGSRTGGLLAAERLATPIAPAVNGDKVEINPKIIMFSEF